MIMPKLSPLAGQTKTVNAFGGYVPRENAPENSFFDMCDLSADKFPLMSVRQKRLRWSVNGMPDFGNGKFSLCQNEINDVANVAGRTVICTKTRLIVNGSEVPDVTLSDISPDRHKIAVFGKSFLVYPDGVLFEANSSGYTVKYTNFNKSFSDVTTELIDEDGDIFEFNSFGDTLPTNPAASTVFLLTRSDGISGYRFIDGRWSNEIDLAIRLSAAGIGEGRCADERLYISGITSMQRKCTVEYSEYGQLYVKIHEYPPLSLTDLGAQFVITNVTLSRRMPKADFMCEHENRLWGCRYGQNNEGESVNEIYASALGDAGEWDKFDGISTDSFSAALGCSGEFTGMCSLGGEVLVFKEDYIITVGGNTPSDFSVRTSPARGVKKNACASLKVLNEKAFYLSESGITVYDGTLPYAVYEAYDTENFVCKCAETHRGKYYLCLRPASGEDYILVFDTKTGLVHKESDRENTVFFVRTNGQLFGVCEKPSQTSGGTRDYTFWNMYPTSRDAFDIFRLTDVPLAEYTYIEESSGGWYGILQKIGAGKGNTSVVRGINFRMKLGENAWFKASVRCNGEKSFKDVCYIEKPREGLFSFRVNTPRCDSFALMLQGEGECVISEMKLITESTSEVTRHG